MSSDLTVPVTTVNNIREHPNADKLLLADALGWQIVMGKDNAYTEGQRIVFVQPDSVLHEKLSDALGITQYLSLVKYKVTEGQTPEDKFYRVKQVRLRGEPSYGATIGPEFMLKHFGIDLNALELEADLRETLGIHKFEPPVRPQAGDILSYEHPLFHRYTNIQHLRRYPNLIPKDATVVATEKIHGTNSRVALIDGEWVAGSHKLQRERPADNELAQNMYWFPYTIDSVRQMLEYLSQKHKQVVLYGEVYGKVQKGYNYGLEGKLGYRAFDLYLDGEYVDFYQFEAICKGFGVPIVPVLGIFPYRFEHVKELVEGYDRTTIGGATHPIEGAVIKTVKEMRDPRLGRLILKYISDAYMFDNKKSDFTEV